MRRALQLLALCLSMALSAGCVGIYNNSANFLNPPKEGMSELDVLQTYGTPAFSGFVEDRKVYTYKVRDNKYIVLVGIYDGYDLVVVCQNGLVTQTRRVDRPNALAILQPLPWAVAD